MNISRTVPYYFARFVGVSQGTVNVSAEAQAARWALPIMCFQLGYSIVVPRAQAPAIRNIRLIA